MKTPRTRTAALMCVFALIALACGQKPGVHVAGSNQLGGVDDEGNPIALGPGDSTSSSSTDVTTNGTSGTTNGTSGTGSGSIGSGGSSGGGPSSQSAIGDTTGVTKTSIKVGFHAPITGASAVALSDIRLGANLLRDYLEANNVKIHGRSTTTIIRDDQYSPSHAVAVCRELVEQQKVFYLIGGGGTDQVQACARYAASKGVPYLSAGVTENGLKGLKQYFAFSATYPDQAKPLAQMIKNLEQPALSPNTNAAGAIMQDRCVVPAPGPTTTSPCINPMSGAAKERNNDAQVGLIYSDTEGFYDARDAFLKEFQAEFGRPVNKVKAITKFSMSSSDANSTMLDFRTAGIDVIYILTAPTNWLEMLNRANSQQYWPKWVGVGITKGLNIVAGTLGCGRYPVAIHGSLFLSPWFSTRHPDASQFVEAFDRYVNDSRDAREVDLAFAVWGGSITQAAMLYNAGPNLTRKGFIATTEKAQNLTWTPSMGFPLKQVYPSVSYSATNHFGVQQAHLLWAHCQQAQQGGAGYWDYLPGKGHFASGF